MFRPYGRKTAYGYTLAIFWRTDPKIRPKPNPNPNRIPNANFIPTINPKIKNNLHFTASGKDRHCGMGVPATYV